MDTLKAVLQAYSIQPFYIEKQTEHLYKVQDHYQQYALKQSRLTQETVGMWEQVYNIAYTDFLSLVLPVYLTKQGKLYEIQGDSIYYVTPWKGNSLTELDQPTIEKLFQSIGRMHAKTKQQQMVESDQLKRTFQHYKQHCKQLQLELLAAVEQFEKNRFMSPFELLVCTQFKELDYSLQETVRRIDQLLYEQEENSTWYYSLCHKNITTSHTLTHQAQLYLINWEKAGFDYPIFDLVTFFHQETSEYDAPLDLFMHGFDKYMDENELTKKELYLLVIQLLDTQAYLACVTAHKKTKATMIEQIIHLQHIFRRILFGLHFSAYVDQTYDTIDLDDLDEAD
ncbi:MULTISPECIES: hypothetical protein [Clostridia]|uniref:hypothetical protein n=1 Tax=Clostridia TaxID=186801 RepID=UPI000EA09186|nr:MULTISPECIES: hypothetical protein [Clostridia]NBJ68673.1 hypothetical protein [Roseburia sp. 1XD42-34]RKI80652.1 hypothetical protein D7V87_03735 [Clostridium sp. 1xD42-85]